MPVDVRPFRLVRPQANALPVLFDSPHSGMEWPEDFRPVALPEAIRTTWDAYVEQLWSGVPLAGATLLAANFPRAYIDPNRAADDIDPELLTSPWPAALAPTDYSRRGMGLIRRFALPGVPMYAGPLSHQAVQHRLATYYHPYRAALGEILDELHGAHGAVWHINCHSMKSRGNAMNVDAGALRPDFVISDRRGVTADPAFTEWVAAWFTGRGYRVKINDPYLGGDLVASYGRPQARRHSVQIEINRALYLDESAMLPLARFVALREELTEFALALAGHVRQQL